MSAAVYKILMTLITWSNSMAQHTRTVSLAVSITMAQHHGCPFIKIS